MQLLGDPYSMLILASLDFVNSKAVMKSTFELTLLFRSHLELSQCREREDKYTNIYQHVY
jgi:hypothetical protein